MSMARSPLTRAEGGERLSEAECLALAACDDLDALMGVAASFNARPLTPPVESNVSRRRSPTVAAVQH